MELNDPHHSPRRQQPPRLRRVLGWSAVCAALLFFGIGSASADTYDCFPLCPQEPTPQTPRVASPQPPTGSAQPKPAGENVASTITACPPDARANIRDAIEQMEALNDQVKPIKDVVGYVQSPQSLAIKLINDYVVRIPAWIGYIMDPVGSLKSRAIGEARDFAKDELKKSVAAGPTQDGKGQGGESLTTNCRPIIEDSAEATPSAKPENEPKPLRVPGK